MKKLILLSVLILAQAAFGSNARLKALGSAPHLTDFQTILVSPSDMLLLPESMELNFGGSTVGQNTSGGMIRNLGEAKLAFLVGAADKARTNYDLSTGKNETATTYLGVENPFTVAYAAKMGGDMSWGVLFNYSSSNKKGGVADTDDQKQDHMSLVGSFVLAETTLSLKLGLADKAKGNGTTESNEMKSAPLELYVLHNMADWTIHGHYYMDKIQNTGAEDTKLTQMEIGAINNMKSEGADFFYGLSYKMDNLKMGSDKFDKSTMPVIIGIETDAASWLTLRGSVKQNVLLGGVKSTVSATTKGTNSNDHDTKVAAGMGFKFTKSMLDITLTGASSGAINANSFGADAGFTYLF